MPLEFFPEFMHDTIKMLNTYDPFVLKLFVIVLSIVIIYIVRNVLLDYLEKGLLKIARVEDYTKQIISKIRKPTELLMIIINFDIIIFVYNDYNAVEVMREIFGIVYIIMLTYMIYLLQNSVVTIKLENTEKKDKIKNEVVNIGLKIFNFVIFLIGLLVALHFAGVNLTAILSGLGIGGLAVALAAKETLSNFFGTLSILLSDSFSQGDWIVAGSVEGIVVEIGLRVTTVRTFDNALISVPNATLANTDIKNWTRRRVGRRIKMSLGVKYDSKREDIQNAIREIRTMLENHPKIATDQLEYDLEGHKSYFTSEDDEFGVKKTLLIFLDEFGPSSINILVYCFSKTVVWAEWLAVKEEVMLTLMEILEKNNLEFAFPSLSIYEEKS